MDAKTILAIIVVVGGATLYRASEWWERAYATYSWSETSPDGCIRIDTYKPFWVLPSMFHRSPDPDPTIRRDLGRPWDAAIFKRAYEVSTDTFLGESIVYDPAASIHFIDWGDTAKPGRRVVVADQFPLVDTNRCADEATLAKLEAYHERQREANRPIQEAWERDFKRAHPPSDLTQ
jgi:hypothetical protein